MTAARDLTAVSILSPRLSMRSFRPSDAAEAFAAATPAVTRYMEWDPPPSLQAFADDWRAWLPAMAAGTDLPLVVRLASTHEFLGVAGLHLIGSPEPEVGIWIKEAAHGAGYGREAIAATIKWASRHLGAAAFTYPVVVENLPSRRLAESLGGTLVGTRVLRKPSGAALDEVVYRIAVRAGR